MTGGKGMNETSVVFEQEDRKICEELLSPQRWEKNGKKSISELVISVGKHFLEAPYVAHAIDGEDVPHATPCNDLLAGKPCSVRDGAQAAEDETLIINLRQFDCVTFVENVMALAQLIEAGKTVFEDFIEHLARIRYRCGVMEGYSSRLHYFSDWLHDNENKGTVKDMTAKIGGKPCLKKIHFMTGHSQDYPGLRIDSSYREMRAVEERISGKPLYFIPRTELESVEEKIESGDIIGVVTGIEGLDVIHVGFALKINNGVHLLHASEVEKKVVVSDNTLNRYLFLEESRLGILAGRIQPIPACQSGDNPLMK
jgi:hypothetical protein